jgi:hypothetical protein
MSSPALRSASRVAGALPPPRRVSALAALSPRAHAVVAALRCIAAGLSDCPSMGRLTDDGLGCARGEGLARVFLFARMLSHAAHRPLAVGWPGCGALTGLERAIAAALEDDGDVDALGAILGGPPDAALAFALTSLRAGAATR